MIEPALTAEEWESRQFDLGESRCSEVDWRHRHFMIRLHDCGESDTQTHYLIQCEAAKMIAAMNDHLPDSDPRKITREQVFALRYASEYGDSADFPELKRLADALESYLPPGNTTDG